MASDIKHVLICGDSFAITDTRYPGLHWSEKIVARRHRVSNVALGGSTNAQIALQVQQGICNLNPDFVIVHFTAYGRAEFDKNVKPESPPRIDDAGIRDRNFNRYDTSCYDNESKNKLWFDYLINAASDEFEVIKNYFSILGTLQYLQIKNIPFCWSMGGLFDRDIDSILHDNLIKNELHHYENRRIQTNLWLHADQGESAPWFHVSDESVLQKFCDECLIQIEKNNPWV